MIPDINLLPKVDKRQSNPNVLYILLAVIALLGLAFLVWQFFSAKIEITSLESKEESLIAQRDEIQMQLELLTNDSTGSLEQSVEFVELVSYPVTPLINETKRLQPPNSYLREYSFEAEGVTMIVDFETLTEISSYVSRLNSSQYFVDVQVMSVENFHLGPEVNTDNFKIVPRYSVEIVLLLNETFLATGGGES